MHPPQTPPISPTINTRQSLNAYLYTIAPLTHAYREVKYVYPLRTPRISPTINKRLFSNPHSHPRLLSFDFSARVLYLTTAAPPSLSERELDDLKTTLRCLTVGLVESKKLLVACRIPFTRPFARTLAITRIAGR